MNNDMVGYCMMHIAKYDQGRAIHTFTAAELSNELCRVSKIKNGIIDGQIILTILNGRSDVVVLGSGYYGLLLKE